MTNQELKNILETLPDNALVVTDGYETGFEPIKEVQLIKVEENKSREWWDGKYKLSDLPASVEVIFLDAKTK
jgi:hypothetical protein